MATTTYGLAVASTVKILLAAAGAALAAGCARGYPPAPLYGPGPGTDPQSLGRVYVKAYEFEGITAVHVEEIDLGSSLELRGAETLKPAGDDTDPFTRGVDGNVLGVPMTIVARADDWRFLKCHGLNWLLDGARLQTPTEHDGHVGRGYVLEFISFRLTYADFVQLSQAQTVRGKLCNTEFALLPSQIALLREFGEEAGIYEAQRAYEEKRVQPEASPSVGP